LLAHRLLGRATVPAKIYPAGADALLISASENLNREQLSPMEEAGVVEKFTARGESVAGIARLFRRSPAWVSSRLALLDLPEDVQGALHRGELSLGVAAILGQIEHADYRVDLIAEAQRIGANARTASLWLAHYQSDPARYAQNRATVEEIRSNREKFVLHVECEGCRTDTPYGASTSLRLCAKCYAELLKGLGEAAPV
jgi:hypothetical protein